MEATTSSVNILILKYLEGINQWVIFLVGLLRNIRAMLTTEAKLFYYNLLNRRRETSKITLKSG